MNKRRFFSLGMRVLCSFLLVSLFASCTNFMDFQEDIGNIKKKATYTVTFDGAGATTAANPATMTVTDPAITIAALPVAPEKTGYTFGGWYTEANGLGTVFTASTSVTASVTVYAKWTQIFHTVTFNANNGTGSMAPQVIGETVTAALTANTLTRANYTFMGWSTSINAVEPTFTDAASYTMGSSNVTLYAIWRHNTLVGLSAKSLSSVSMSDVATVVGGYLTTATGTPYNQETSTSGGFAHCITPFTMGTYQVTYELWYTVRSWALLNGYTFANPGREGNDDTIGGAAPTESAKLEPVTTINWRDAMVWCNAYSQMAGKIPYYYMDASYTSVLKTVTDTGSINATAGSEDNPCVKAGATGYRLPTEGEWQYAASCAGVYPYDYASGADAKYDATTGGSDIDGNGIVRYSNDVAWYSSNSSSKTQPVGMKHANKFGLYDMSGNVCEWCWDWYGSNPTVAQTDYKGPATGSDRIRRGGSWSQDSSNLQVGDRHFNPPYYECSIYGFRVIEDR